MYDFFSLNFTLQYSRITGSSQYIRLDSTKFRLKEYPPIVSAWDQTQQHFPRHNHLQESGMHQQSPFLYPGPQMAQFARDWKDERKRWDVSDDPYGFQDVDGLFICYYLSNAPRATLILLLMVSTDAVGSFRDACSSSESRSSNALKHRQQKS